MSLILLRWYGGNIANYAYGPTIVNTGTDMDRSKKGCFNDQVSIDQGGISYTQSSSGTWRWVHGSKSTTSSEEVSAKHLKINNVVVPTQNNNTKYARIQFDQYKTSSSGYATVGNINLLRNGTIVSRCWQRSNEKRTYLDFRLQKTSGTYASTSDYFTLTNTGKDIYDHVSLSFATWYTIVITIYPTYINWNIGGSSINATGGYDNSSIWDDNLTFNTFSVDISFTGSDKGGNRRTHVKLPIKVDTYRGPEDIEIKSTDYNLRNLYYQTHTYGTKFETQITDNTGYYKAFEFN